MLNGVLSVGLVGGFFMVVLLFWNKTWLADHGLWMGRYPPRSKK